MTVKSKLFSLDDEANQYIETIPKQKRSEVVREGLKLHKFQHREKDKPQPKIEVRLHK